jgi:hypothetical protein
MYPMRGVDWNVHRIKYFRPVYKYWVLENNFHPPCLSFTKGGNTYVPLLHELVLPVPCAESRSLSKEGDSG